MVTKRPAARQPTPVNIRFPRDLLDRVDAYAERLRRDRPGLTVSRGTPCDSW